jgi:hypothetical protein
MEKFEQRLEKRFPRDKLITYRWIAVQALSLSLFLSLSLSLPSLLSSPLLSSLVTPL